MLLYSDPYISLHHYPQQTHVRLVRSEKQFESVSRVASSLRDGSKKLEGIDVARLGLLMDWRLAPLSTDPVMLKHVVQHIDRFAARFARRALLLATQVGVMQSERIARTINHAKPVLFDDEAEALAYAKGDGV
ncbi:MAG: hypothetical protein ABW133_19525 [Polyangiaceae bacterium]